MPISDRDYMRSSPQREPRRYRSYRSFNLSAVWMLIILNFLVFVASMVSSQVLVNLGLVPAYFTQRPWTILTSMFVHGSFWHIFGNMLTLYFFGNFLTRLVGQNKFLLLYFGGGLLGNLIYVWLGAPLSIAIGASGAVYAIAGALAVMVPNLRVFVYFIVPMRLWIVVLVFFVLWSFIPGVAWQAHLGGLVAGLIAGYVFRKRGRYYSF